MITAIFLLCLLQKYYVAHIDELQALVIVEHDSGQNNLYLSDEKGLYFSLSLPDLVVERTGIDLEVVRKFVFLTVFMHLHSILKVSSQPW